MDCIPLVAILSLLGFVLALVSSFGGWFDGVINEEVTTVSIDGIPCHANIGGELCNTASAMKFLLMGVLCLNCCTFIFNLMGCCIKKKKISHTFVCLSSLGSVACMVPAVINAASIDTDFMEFRGFGAAFYCGLGQIVLGIFCAILSFIGAIDEP